MVIDKWTEGPLQPKEENTNRVGWKLYVALLLAWSTWAIYFFAMNYKPTKTDMFFLVPQITFFMLCLFGLYGFAFKKRLLNRKVWKATFIIFVGYFVIDATYNIYNCFPEIEYYIKGALLNALLIAAPISYCLYGYAFREIEPWK
jgi:FtsH-binding integral membrane protein